jgi:hypothetical protein
MRHAQYLSILVGLSLVTSGCSSRPRYFIAQLDPARTDTAKFETDMAMCRELVGRGYKSDFAAQAAAIGTGTIATTGVAGASIAATAGFFESTAASTALGAAALPVGLLVGFGVSRMIRGGREKKLKLNLSNCMTEFGHSVIAWTPTKRPKKAKVAKEAPPAG